MADKGCAGNLGVKIKVAILAFQVKSAGDLNIFHSCGDYF